MPTHCARFSGTICAIGAGNSFCVATKPSHADWTPARARCLRRPVSSPVSSRRLCAVSGRLFDGNNDQPNRPVRHARHVSSRRRARQSLAVVRRPRSLHRQRCRLRYPRLRCRHGQSRPPIPDGRHYRIALRPGFPALSIQRHSAHWRNRRRSGGGRAFVDQHQAGEVAGANRVSRFARGRNALARAIEIGKPPTRQQGRQGGLRDQPELGRQGGRQSSNLRPQRLINGASGVWLRQRSEPGLRIGFGPSTSRGSPAANRKVGRE